MYKKKLTNELKSLRKSPVSGFEVNPNESNILEWNVTIYGPPDTLFEGGVFRAKMSFPKDYPFSPPKLQFKSKFWHPNVYPDGRVCISILHTPDPQNPEEADACWTPVQRVETILLSVISMLSDPNLSSPANVDAGVELRRSPEIYMQKVLRCVEQSRASASPDELVVASKNLSTAGQAAAAAAASSATGGPSSISSTHMSSSSSTSSGKAAARPAVSASSSSTSTSSSSNKPSRRRGRGASGGGHSGPRV